MVAPIASPPKDSPPQPSPVEANNNRNNNNDQTVDDVSSLELLFLRSAGAEPHFFGASSAYSFTKMFSASLRAVRKQGPGLTMSGIMDKTCQARPLPTPAPLPNRAIVTMLTTAYFEQIHPQFPFLHRPTYQNWEEEVLAASEAGTTPNPVSAFFVFAVSEASSQENIPKLTYQLCAVGALTGPLAGATLPEVCQFVCGRSLPMLKISRAYTLPQKGCSNM